MIISASRRTDIPALYGEWFINRLKEGYLLVQNPYDERRYSKVILTNDSIDLIVFWTKNPMPFLKYLPIIDKMGYQYYFQFTLTPYDKDIESNLPNKETLLEAFINLSDLLGSKRVIWRYDPILFNDKYTPAYHINKFSLMCKTLSGYTTRCIISFVDSYNNVATRTGEKTLYNMSNRNILTTIEAFSQIASQHNIELFTCSEPIDLSKFGVKKGSCIDKNLIEDILEQNINIQLDKNQREHCRCVESIEIGTYNSCTNGCRYCYALKNEKISLKNLKAHNSYSPLLFGELNKDAIITTRSSLSVKNKQLKLF